MPATPPSKHLNRDERLQVQTLRLAGHSQQFIANLLGFTRRQVQYADTSERVTPKKCSGRNPTLTNEQVDQLEVFVCSSRTGRLMSYLQLASGPFSDWQVGEYVIRNALRKRGYSRHVARAKPPLSPENRRIRLQWAQNHVNWTREQWCLILWSDETWVTGGRHKKQWVTRRAGEEVVDTCVVDKIRKRRGWMFWGCFAGDEKGPCLFWEKEWGSINKTSYCERVVPLIHGWIRMNPHLQFMQDGAPGHSAASTKEELLSRGIHTIFWPAYSPDLNPIETIWNWIKDYIEMTYGDVQLSYDQLRVAVRAGWDSITKEQLNELIDSMKERCEAVIAAEGGYTKF